MIRLAVNIGRRFKAGAHIEESELEPAFLEQLLAAGQAERVGAQLVSAELANAIAAVKAAGDLFMASIDTVVAVALAGPPGSAAAVEDALEAWFRELGTEQRDAQHRALKEARRRDADHEIQSDGRGPQDPVQDEAERSASEGGAGDGAASSEVSSGVEQPAARVAHTHEVAGSNPAPAPNDAPQPEAGADGDGGAPAPPEPAAQAEPKPKKPARKGGGKAAD